MNRRNWLGLSRKLVDVTDWDYSFNAVQSYMANNNLAFFGEGVLVTTTYPNPFPITLANTSLTGTVGQGIAYDPTGLQVRIDDANGQFSMLAADANNTRYDLLVLRYNPTGDTQIPEPDQPTNQVYLNIHDGYQVAVIAGTPAVAPAYPAKGQFDIILAGLQVPANAQTGSSVLVDLSIREIATPLRSFFPTFVQESLSGTVDGNNQIFTMSQSPLNQSSALVMVDGLALKTNEWTLSNNQVTLLSAPQIGQTVYAYYVVNSSGSINPVAGTQEVPTGTIDGTNATFTLAGRPVNQASMQVYIDSVLIGTAGWSLVQNANSSQIVFAPSSIPQPGQDVYAFYLMNAVAMAPQQAQSSGGGSVNLATEYPQLQSGDVTNGYVTLAHTPANPTVVLLDVIGAGAQAYGSDFTVSGNKLYWTNSLLAAGDQLRVHYNY